MGFPPFKKSVHIGVPILNWKLVFLYGSARKKKLYSSEKDFFAQLLIAVLAPKIKDSQFPDV